MGSKIFDNLHIPRQHQRLITPAAACLSWVTARNFWPLQAINQSATSYYMNRTWQRHYAPPPRDKERSLLSILFQISLYVIGLINFDLNYLNNYWHLILKSYISQLCASSTTCYNFKFFKSINFCKNGKPKQKHQFKSTTTIMSYYVTFWNNPEILPPEVTLPNSINTPKICLSVMFWRISGYKFFFL